MREKVSTDLLISRIAARQHGLITSEQLKACGLTDAGIGRRVAAGRLFRIHRGVYAVGHPNLTHHARWKAATLAVRASVLSHRSAAELWQMLEPSQATPQITIPYPASAAKRPDIHIHRSRTLPRIRTGSRSGIPVTLPSRTLADLALVGTPAEVRRAQRSAEKRGLPLDDDHIPERTESDLEREFLAICRRFDIPEPRCQVQIGRHRVDFYWPDAGLVLETDGYVYHRGRQAMRDDNDRDIELEIRGLRVIRVDDSRIDDDPAGLARDVLALVAPPNL
jgi:very-short-patch-repair endonuclease